MIEKINYKNNLLALIIRKKKYEKKKGINFFTSQNLPLQVAYMQHVKNHKIQPHIHKKIMRKTYSTPEVLIIKKGRMKVDFYNNKKKYLKSRVLFKDDIILLLQGAHGFKIQKDCSFIEVKQGPYKEKSDKDKF